MPLTARLQPLVATRRDLVAGAITIAAVLLVGGSASRMVAVRGPGGIDTALLGALLLNVALVLFGWRRYRDLSREVIERTAAEERAQALAMRDPLTGLPNRRALIELAGGATATHARRRLATALLLIDLDNFRAVNEAQGHLVGDALLRAVAALLEAAAPAGAILARIGADEFALAMAFNAERPEAVTALGLNLVKALSQPFDLGADGLAYVGGAIGMARSDHGSSGIESLLRRADIAMSAAKKAGGGRATWFDDGMERELKARNAVELGLRRGIPLGQFVPYYEQQIDLATGALHGFEVLARWNHPTDGLVAPDTFIGIAEETGLIGDLSMSVIRQALEEARGWAPNLTLSVNISPAQLKDPWLAQKIVKLLVETGFPANRLEVEITESSLFDNLALAQAIVGSLKNQGIRIALDDFGTGYSSLSHLRALPFDRIKIDKSFVLTMQEDSESAAIVDAIAKLGGSLNLPVTAEGIEDPAVLAKLLALGCHKGQGFHYGRPMSIIQVRRLLADKALLGVGAAETAGGQRRAAG